VETELRRRAEARGLLIGSSLPEGALSWVSYLLKRDCHDTMRREAPLAMGGEHSLFVDREGRLHLACSLAAIQAGEVGGPLLGHDWSSASVAVPPTLVSSMQGKRIVSVASSKLHCLALSDEGEVYSWGDGTHGALGHADGGAGTGPRRIETLAHVESVAAGPIGSAAVDDRGTLFTWGRTTWQEWPTGLGCEHDPETECQLTPKRVDALLQDRVVGVALGLGFTLAVTDAGAVFSFGSCFFGALGHGSMESEVLPRRIDALTQTDRRFIAVTAGHGHALALAEEGEVYGWGHLFTNGRGEDLRTPQLVTALAGQRVKLVYAQECSSCAVTASGELYTWGHVSPKSVHLGHGVKGPQRTPKRVGALHRAKVAAAAIGYRHTLVADTDGVGWAFGECSAIGLGNAVASRRGTVVPPTPIGTVYVRTLP